MRPERPLPIGPTICEKGTNFSLFSVTATKVELLLFDGVDDLGPSRTIVLNAECNRTSHYWHVLVCGIMPGQLYGFRVHGPDDPAAGHRFDSQKVLLDPYGRSVAVGKNYDRAAACRPGDTAATCMKSVVVDCSRFDWEDDVLLNLNGNGTVNALTNSGAALFATPVAAAAAIFTPTAISVDTAGSLWIASSGDNSAVEIIGVAAPVVAPTVKAVVNSNPGTRP